MARIELPAGAWAELRDPDVVTERQRRPVVTALGRASKYEGMEDGGMAALVNVADAVLMAMVEAWSFAAPITMDGLDDLPAKTVTALRKACEPFQKELLPDFGPTPDPATPTVPSND